ncbi:divalent-cation tolerance protein CutA [Parasphingorhabdus cellanae]|uniref:Divalent-cation tolerance protein CutA n=1 Tax=Parasphingorhabdus cellanae TaxID=2806553 RepID=A0ABX7T148_9SPHN|nr:divalent-cation tolerance protein CutA [Parasphingorhabdus cellanae]QTD54881.1 divalent-cation tolerance protein CutA [Parasphingorhabdus cellanae]
MTDQPVLIYTLFGASAEARQVAKTLISEKLVACANHFAPATAQYVWDGDFCEDEEYPVLLKTTESQAKAAMQRLKKLHSYDTPAILSWAADDSDPAYAKWLSTQLEE